MIECPLLTGMSRQWQEQPKGKPWEEGGGLPGNENSSDRRHDE